MDDDEKAARNNDLRRVNNLLQAKRTAGQAAAEWRKARRADARAGAEMIGRRGLLHRTNDTFYRCNRVWTGGLASAGPGQSKQKDFLTLIEGINLDEKGKISVTENFQTSNKKYFAAGDAVSGGQEVVNAAADGKKAAWGIKRLLS